MMRTIKLGMAAVILLALTTAQAQAGTMTFDFSITTDGSLPNPGVPVLAGTVTGEIVLASLTNGTEAATSIFIDSYPSGLGSLGSITDAVLWNGPYGINSFTLTNGEITNSEFASTDVVGSNSLNLFINYGGTNWFQAYTPGTGDNIVGNYDGESGLNYTSLSVPEPSSFCLAALAVVCGIAYRVTNKRRAIRTNAA